MDDKMSETRKEHRLYVQDDDLDRRITWARYYFDCADRLENYSDKLNEGSCGQEFYSSIIGFMFREGAKEITKEEHSGWPSLDKDGLKDIITTLKDKKSLFSLSTPLEELLCLLQKKTEIEAGSPRNRLITDLFTQICDAFVEFYPCVESYGTRHQLRRTLGKTPEALSDLDKIIELEKSSNYHATPNLVWYYKTRGIERAESGDFKGGIEDFNRIIELYQTDPYHVIHTNIFTNIEIYTSSALGEIYTRRGQAKFNLGEYEEAMQDFEKSLEVSPYAYRSVKIRSGVSGSVVQCDDLDPYLLRASANLKLGRDEEAITDITKAIDILSERDLACADYFFYRGSVKLEMGRFEEAVLDLDKSIKLNPKFAVTFNMRGVAKYKLDRFEEALADCEKAVELDPKNPIFYDNRGWLKIELDRFEEALEDYQKAAEFGNPNHEQLGYVKLKLGREDEALGHFNEQIRIEPLPNSYSWRGGILEKRGYVEDAGKDYRTALELLDRIPVRQLHKNHIRHLVKSTRGLRRIGQKDRVELKVRLKTRIKEYRSAVKKR